jgi:hypothetical protein
LSDDEVTPLAKSWTICRHRRVGQGDVSREARRATASTRPLEAQITVRMSESGGARVERKLTLPVTPDGADDRHQADVLRPLARRWRQCRFDVVMAAPDGKTLANRRCVTIC